jgi:hypothetical protein
VGSPEGWVGTGIGIEVGGGVGTGVGKDVEYGVGARVGSVLGTLEGT